MWTAAAVGPQPHQYFALLECAVHSSNSWLQRLLHSTPGCTAGRHCTINHKQNDSQDVDETEVADKAEKGPFPKKKAEPKRTSRKEPVSCASEKGPKKKKTNIDSGKPSKP